MIGAKIANPVVQEKTVYEFAQKDVQELIRELKDPFNVSPEAREFVDFLWNEYLTRPKKPLSSYEQYKQTYPLIGGGVYRSPTVKTDAFDPRYDTYYDTRYAGSGYTLKGVMDSIVESN